MRIAALEGYLDKVRALNYVEDYTSMIGVSHQGKKKPHYHLVIRTHVKPEAFRARMKKVFNSAKGNENMAISPWDGNIKALSYLFHEITAEIPSHSIIILRKEISDETIADMRALNETIQNEVKKAKSKASWTIEQELLDEYRKKKIKPHVYVIAKDIMLHAWRNDKYAPNDFLLKAMANKIAFKLLDGNLGNEEQFAILQVETAYRMDYDQKEYFKEIRDEGGRGV